MDISNDRHGVAHDRPCAPGHKLLPHSKMRRAVADRVSESKSSIPHFYQTVDVEMDSLASLRERTGKQEEKSRKPSLTAFIIKACGVALSEFPSVNSSYTDEGLLLHDQVNIGCVAALEEGMLIPVIRDADTKSIFTIDEELTDLVSRAKQRRLLPDAYSGGTFTVSNLGMIGIRTFAAIISPPESAILAVGTIRKELRLKDSELSESRVMSLTLSCDHRSVDGITAAKFLVKVKELLEKPDSIIHT